MQKNPACPTRNIVSAQRVSPHLQCVLTFIAYVTCFTVACRMTDWCLKQSSNDDFDWSFGKSCTETKETGPCNDVDLNIQGEFLSTRQVMSLFFISWLNGVHNEKENPDWFLRTEYPAKPAKKRTNISRYRPHASSKTNI